MKRYVKDAYSSLSKKTYRDKNGNLVQGLSPAEETIADFKEKAGAKIKSGVKKFGDVGGVVLNAPMNAVKAMGEITKGYDAQEKALYAGKNSKERLRTYLGGIKTLSEEEKQNRKNINTNTKKKVKQIMRYKGY